MPYRVPNVVQIARGLAVMAIRGRWWIQFIGQVSGSIKRDPYPLRAPQPVRGLLGLYSA
jgi:hypothetical protein